MKIAIDARMYGLENTGIGRYTLELINSLVKIDAKNEYHILLRKKYYQKLKLPKNWNKVLADIDHYSLKEQTLVPKIISEINPDLTHFVHFNVPLLFKGRFVVTIHDLLMHKQRGFAATTLPPYAYLVKRLAYKSVFANAVKKSCKVIVPSNAVKEELESYYKLATEKTEVTYEGINEPIKSSGNNAVLKKYGLAKEYFIYTGNAYPHKNLGRLIEALGLINKELNNHYLLAIVCARNVFSERLERQIKKLGAEKYVRLLGFVSDEELAVLYQTSKAFVFPSLSEGFGLTGLEAMSAGTMVAASDIKVFREVYKDNAVYFNPFDFTSIARNLEEIIKMGEGEKSERIKKAQKFISRYSWDKMARKTLKVYENCARLRSGK